MIEEIFPLGEGRRDAPAVRIQLVMKYEDLTVKLVIGPVQGRGIEGCAQEIASRKI